MVEELLRNQTFDFIAPQWTENHHAIIGKISDKEHLAFLKKTNGGYFFKNAIHIFGVTTEFVHHDLEHTNNYINSCYDGLSSGVFFGEDIFGNLFGFSKEDIIYFDIETADTKNICDNFQDWINILLEEIDYYAAYSILDKLDISTIQWLSRGKRLAPKMAFVLGGSYELDNLSLKDSKENIAFNASIARQIHDQPDGTKFSIDIK